MPVFSNRKQRGDPPLSAFIKIWQYFLVHTHMFIQLLCPRPSLGNQGFSAINPYPGFQIMEVLCKCCSWGHACGGVDCRRNEWLHESQASYTNPDPDPGIWSQVWQILPDPLIPYPDPGKFKSRDFDNEEKDPSAWHQTFIELVIFRWSGQQLVCVLRFLATWCLLESRRSLHA